MVTAGWQPGVTLTYDETTYTYTAPDRQIYPGYVRVFIPEDPAEELLISALIGYPPSRSGYTIGYLTTHDADGNVISPETPPVIPPVDGCWTVDA